MTKLGAKERARKTERNDVQHDGIWKSKIIRILTLDGILDENNAKCRSMFFFTTATRRGGIKDVKRSRAAQQFLCSMLRSIRKAYQT